MGVGCGDLVLLKIIWKGKVIEWDTVASLLLS